MTFFKIVPSKIGLLLSVAFMHLMVSPVWAASPLVSTGWLADNLSNEQIVIIDLRNKLDKGSYETFKKGHIPGSVHSDYLKDGWRVGKDNVVGLLPSEAQFEALAQKLGVSDYSHVVLIPAGVNATDFGSAARAYWTFKTFGHDNVSVLDGGYRRWADDYPQQIETGGGKMPAAGNFKAVFKANNYVDGSAVAQRVAAGTGAVLLDGRTEEQFYGSEKHPKARTHGRLPGAVLHSQSLGYNDATNQLKTRTELAEIYGDYADQPIISYCNTGHWAATNWFVISEVLGNKEAKLYDGSMVEWSSDENNPLETGKSNLERIKGFFSKLAG